MFVISKIPNGKWFEEHLQRVPVLQLIRKVILISAVLISCKRIYDYDNTIERVIGTLMNYMQ